MVDPVADENRLPPARIAEAHAIAVAGRLAGSTILCSSLGRAQAAVELASNRPQAAVTCWFLDHFAEGQAIAEVAPRDNLKFVCTADLPAGPFDTVVLPLSFRGEAELARDLIQDAHARLTIGGHLVVSVDNRNDRWVHGQLREMFPKVSVDAGVDAVGYVVRKTAPQKRPRPLACRFTFRDRDRVLQIASRPGVFSHRRLDPGARQLIDAIPHPLAGRDGEPLRIVDIGCGSGAVGVAIAARDGSAAVEVLAIDSNARAVECAARSAALNGVNSLTAVLDSAGESVAAAAYDVAVANPPYYADFRIARLFVDIANTALRPGGQLYLVTKHAAWYQENLVPGWRDASIRRSGQYFIVTARRG